MSIGWRHGDMAGWLSEPPMRIPPIADETPSPVGTGIRVLRVFWLKEIMRIWQAHKPPPLEHPVHGHLRCNKRFVRRGWWFEGKGLIIPCHSVCRQSLQLRTWITSATHCKRSGKRCCLSSRVPLTGYAYRLGLQPDTCMCMTCQPEWLILRAGC